jgi:hypothetical protein
MKVTSVNAANRANYYFMLFDLLPPRKQTKYFDPVEISSSPAKCALAGI